MPFCLVLLSHQFHRTALEEIDSGGQTLERRGSEEHPNLLIRAKSSHETFSVHSAHSLFKSDQASKKENGGEGIIRDIN